MAQRGTDALHTEISMRDRSGQLGVAATAVPDRPFTVCRDSWTRGGTQASAREGANGAAQGGICDSGGVQAFAADVRVRAIGRAMFLFCYDSCTAVLAETECRETEWTYMAFDKKMGHQNKFVNRTRHAVPCAWLNS
jgi:hypothetical protein